MGGRAGEQKITAPNSSGLRYPLFLGNGGEGLDDLNFDQATAQASGGNRGGNSGVIIYWGDN
jgi:hypothetical protein